MVIAEQVQGTMDEEVRQLFGQRASASTGLAEGGFRRDDHVPKEMRVELRERPLAHGKGEHVGRSIHPPIASIEPVHAGVIDNEHALVTGLTIEGCEQPLQRLFEAPRVYRDVPLLIPATDGH